MAAAIAGAGAFETYPRIEMDIGRAHARSLRRAARAGGGPVRGAEVAIPWLTPSLRASGLTYRYPEAATDALRDIDLRVEPASSSCSPAARAPASPRCCAPAAGSSRISTAGGSRASSRSPDWTSRSHGPAELAEVVGLVAQEPETQVVSTTVRAEIELPLELRGVPPAARARAVEEVSLALAIDALLERTTDTLSGGELQRVALAAALATRPRLVLLDEPTSQLDPVAGDELISLLRRLNEEWGVAVLLGEHRLERCLAAADRVVALEAGAISFDGAPGDFLEWALVRRSGAHHAGSAAARREAACRPRRASARPAGPSRRRASRRRSRNPPRRAQPGTFAGGGARPRLPSVTSGWSWGRARSGPRPCAASTSGSSPASGSR